MNYDFSQLNDKEFEILVTDLLSIVYRSRIERFKIGRDLGIDGRFFSDKAKEIIIQCKHYLKSGYKALISKLENEESKKVNILKPEKYIIATSLPLSRINKEEIKSIFSPFIKRSDEIFGQEDLNDLLANHPAIEEKHFKLWISSATVFDRIINNAIKGRSQFEIEQIKRKSYKYVRTKSHEKALEILNKNHVLIISGEPGIGKTTLAENLCLYFVSKDYEFIDIQESLSEAENIYHKGRKQIFYFDDFLGSNYFEAIENKKDSHIVKFIERIRNDKNKFFILTSRTNILNLGIAYSHIFANNKIQNNEYMLTIEKLTALDRARILYNHIWFSKLDVSFIDEYYKDKRYKIVIDHNNFNPRLIEFITDIERLSSIKIIDYWGYIENTLDNPRDIWNDCFKRQNNEYVRNIVKLTVFNGATITENQLQDSFYALSKIEKIENPSHIEKDFATISQLATKSFLNRNVSSDNNTYTLFNPSIADYILNEYCSQYGYLLNIFKALDTNKSLDQLVSLEFGNLISSKYASKLKEELFYDSFKQNKNIDYLIHISYLFDKYNDKTNEIIKDLLLRVSNDPVPIQELSRFLWLLEYYHYDLNLEEYKFLTFLIGNRTLHEEEVKILAEFMEFADIHDEDIINILGNNLSIILKEDLDSQKNDIDVSQYVTIHGNGNDIEYDYDDGGIEDELYSVVESKIKSFNSKTIQGLNINRSDIVNSVDIDSMISHFLDSELSPEFDDDHGYYNTFDRAIDDLFEKS